MNKQYYTQLMWTNGAYSIRKLLSQCDSCLVPLADLNGITDDNQTYIRMPTIYDNELFGLLYADPNVECFNKNKHIDLSVDKCYHNQIHQQNTCKITPANIVYSQKLVKWIQEKNLLSLLSEEICKLKIIDKKGKLIADISLISRYLKSYVEELYLVAKYSIYYSFQLQYDLMKAKRVTNNYLTTNSIHLNFISKLMIKRTMINQVIKSSQMEENSDRLEQNYEGYTKITYSNFNELFDKSIVLLWNEWQKEQRLQNSTKDIHDSVVLFKQSIDETINTYDPEDSSSQFYDFKIKYNEKYGLQKIEKKPVKEVTDIINSMIKTSLSFETSSLNLSNDFDNSLKDATLIDCSDDGLISNSLFKTARKFDLSLPNILEESTEKKKNKDANENKYIWASFNYSFDRIQCFLLIYYFNIFHKLNLDAKRFLNVYKYPFKEQNVINKELIKFCKKVDELIDSDVCEEKYKEVILILIKNFKQVSLVNDYSEEVLLQFLDVDHPFFKFDIRYEHICAKSDKSSTLFKKPEAIYLTKSLFTWRFSCERDSHIIFSDYFLDNSFICPEIKINNPCCALKQYSVEIDQFSKYFWIKPEFEKKSISDDCIFEFCYTLKPSWISSQKIELQSIIFSSINSKICILKLKANQSQNKEEYKWYKYNPFISSELSLLEESFVEENSLIIACNDLGDNMTPWLILYSKLQN